MSNYLLNKKLITLIIIGFVIVGIIGIKSYGDYMENTEKAEISDAKIILYKDGKDIVISETPTFPKLQKEMEDFLVLSDNALLELVTKDTITKIKKNEKAVEIIYPKPKEFKVTNPTDSREFIKVDRILIPLEGYYSPNTVFWGFKTYSSGPFINSKGSERAKRIKEIIKNY
jgi:hypothetical protein